MTAFVLQGLTHTHTGYTSQNIYITENGLLNYTFINISKKISILFHGFIKI